MIGHAQIPPPLYERMRCAPTVYLDSPVEERARRIALEYVVSPLLASVDRDHVLAFFVDGIRQVAKRLGGPIERDVRAEMREAFRADPDRPESHISWISLLLVHYYDRAYHHAQAKKDRPVLFRGDAASCRAWLDDNLDAVFAMAPT
jgi:tRNA 2-selenouridine synthase SelU